MYPVLDNHQVVGGCFSAALPMEQDCPVLDTRCYAQGSVGSRVNVVVRPFSRIKLKCCVARGTFWLSVQQWKIRKA